MAKAPAPVQKTAIGMTPSLMPAPGGMQQMPAPMPKAAPGAGKGKKKKAKSAKKAPGKTRMMRAFGE